MADLVPWLESLDDVYSTQEGSQVPDEYRQRFRNLISSFQKTYGQKPDFVSRSPGRVNIIGEHVDYSLYNVLPTAVINDVIIAVQVLDETAEAHSLSYVDL